MARIRLIFAAGVLATLTSCSGGSGLPEVSGPVQRTLELTGSEMRYEPNRISVAAGDVPVVLHNAGIVRHDLRIEGQPALMVEAEPGQTTTATWHLGKGRYRIYCSLPGHRVAGMEGILEVR